MLYTTFGKIRLWLKCTNVLFTKFCYSLKRLYTETHFILKVCTLFNVNQFISLMLRVLLCLEETLQKKTHLILKFSSTLFGSPPWVQFSFSPLAFAAFSILSLQSRDLKTSVDPSEIVFSISLFLCPQLLMLKNKEEERRTKELSSKSPDCSQIVLVQATTFQFQNKQRELNMDQLTIHTFLYKYSHLLTVTLWKQKMIKSALFVSHSIPILVYVSHRWVILMFFDESNSLPLGTPINESSHLFLLFSGQVCSTINIHVLLVLNAPLIISLH